MDTCNKIRAVFKIIIQYVMIGPIMTVAAPLAFLMEDSCEKGKEEAIRMVKYGWTGRLD